MRASDLYWVSRDMSRVALDASSDIPPIAPAAAIPAPYGLLLWDGGMPTLRLTTIRPEHLPRSPLGSPVHPQVPVVGVLWAHYGGQIYLTALCRTEDAVEALPPGVSPDVGGSPLMPQTGIDPIASDREINTSTIGGEGAGLIAATLATWVLMQQPTVASARDLDVKVSAKDRAPRTTPLQPVRIIDLRTMDHHHEDREPGESGREYTHRWIVRGHWRNQSHGPRHTLRRIVWVPSYVKGPADAPLLTTEHVHVWRR